MLPRTTLGIEVLRDSGWAPLVGRRVAALLHAASALPDTLEHTADALVRAAGTAFGVSIPLYLSSATV